METFCEPYRRSCYHYWYNYYQLKQLPTGTQGRVDPVGLPIYNNVKMQRTNNCKSRVYRDSKTTKIGIIYYFFDFMSHGLFNIHNKFRFETSYQSLNYSSFPLLTLGPTPSITPTCHKESYLVTPQTDPILYL